MADEPTKPTADAAHAKTAPLIRRAAPFVYLFAIAITLSAIHVARYQQLSPIDELRHVDYSMRVTEFQIVRLGDVLGQESMKAEACRGVDIPNYRDPPCGSKHFEPVKFRDNGYQTASPHPPTYYIAAGFFARALSDVGIFDDFVDPARLFGGLLLGAGLAVTYVAGRRLGMRPLLLLAALTLVTTASSTLHASSTVNPDATSILAGGVVLLAAVLWEQRRLHIAWLALAGAFATGTKFTNFLAVAVVAIWLAVRSQTGERVIAWLRTRLGATAESEAPATSPVDSGNRGLREWFRDAHLRAACFLVGGAAAAAAIWAFVDRLRATIDPSIIPQNQRNAVDGLPALGYIFSLSHVLGWVPPTEGYDPFTYTGNAALQDFRGLVTYVFAGAMLLACVRVRRREPVMVLGAITTAIALVGGPALAVITALLSNVLAEAGGRYALSLFPIIVMVLIAFVRGRSGTVVLVGFASAAYITYLVTLLFADVAKPLVH